MAQWTVKPGHTERARNLYQFPMNQRMHIIPLGHPEPLHHANLGCWCHPTAKENREIAIHHAKDGREKWERQGIIDQDRPWCIVYEDFTP